MKRTASLLSAACLLATGCILGEEPHVSSTSAAATVVVADPGWRLSRELSLQEVRAARFNPVDGLIYAVRRSLGDGGLYRFDETGAAAFLARGDRPASVAISPISGDVFTAEDYGGLLFRTDPAAGGRSAWVYGFHWGDDDPVGISIAGEDYTGDVLAPGDGLVIDRGSGGPAELWRFSSTTAQGETRVRGDDGQLSDPVAVAIGTESVYVADMDGAIYEVFADGSLQSLDAPVATPNGIAVDPVSGQIYVMDAATDELILFDPVEGTVETILSNLALAPGHWTGIDVSPRGDRLVVTDPARSAVYVLDADHAPVAQCEDRVVRIAGACEAEVSVDAGSYDPDGDAIEVAASPAGPYPLGTTEVTLTATEIASGQSDSCRATVTVEPAGESYAVADDASHSYGLRLPGLYCRRSAYLSFEDAQLTVVDGTANLTGTATVEDSGCRGGEHEGARWELDAWLDEAASGRRGRSFSLRSGEAGLAQVDGDRYVHIDGGPWWKRGLDVLLAQPRWGDETTLHAAFFFTLDDGRRTTPRLGALHADLAPLCD